MKVFLDTNVFYNDWYMKNANFKYLFHYLNNEGHELILSKLVIQETENIRRRDIDSCLSEIKKNIKKAQKLNSSKVNFDENNLGIEEYKLLPLLKSKVDCINVFDYENIPHHEVVDRALTNKKPFLEGDKGYRDTLIWISLLNYIVENHITDEEVIFITENKSDFFKIKDNVVKFHKDLDDDVINKGIKTKIIAFTSLFDFVNSTIDKNEHAIDRFNSESVFEDFVEESGTDFLKNMTNVDLAKYYKSSIFESKVKDILDIRTVVWEGLEDPEFIHTTKLDGNDIYISYKYNLRIVSLEIDIPVADYLENKEELNRLFFDIDVSSDVATLINCVRPYFDVSFIYNDRDQSFKNFEVADLWLRR